MAKRIKPTLRFACAEPGCKEWGFYEYDNRRDQAEGRKRLDKNPWKCTRHAGADRLLSKDRPEIITVMENQLLMCKHDPNKELGLFWGGHNGFAHGNGYIAYAKDFPKGTKLIVTARIEFPGE